MKLGEAILLVMCLMLVFACSSVMIKIRHLEKKSYSELASKGKKINTCRTSLIPKLTIKCSTGTLEYWECVKGEGCHPVKK